MFIGDADDSINSMLNRMKEAADADKAANMKRQPALKKLTMLKVFASSTARITYIFILVLHLSTF